MTPAMDPRPTGRKKSLRRSMIASLTGLALLPLLTALTSLFFVVRSDIGENQGLNLAREAVQIAEKLRPELQRNLQGASGEVLPAELHKLLEAPREGSRKGVVLFTAAGKRLAGRADIPIPPATEVASDWLTFEAGGNSYFAGMAAIKLAGATPPRNWNIAVVEPAAHVYEQLHSVSSQAAFFIIAFVILVAILAWWMANQYMRPIQEIRRGAEIISRINLDHRIRVTAGDEIEELAIAFNLMAENLGKAYGELEERVREATRTLQEERNRLATVLRTMVDAVVVTNESAEIILMNPRARIILGRGYTSGIGAPLARILPDERLNFHLKRLRESWGPGRESVENVVFPLAGGMVLAGSLSVIPGSQGERAGFLLVFRDLSAPSEEGNRLEATLREMPSLLRGPVATSRSLVETLQKHREMPAEKQHSFLMAITEEMDRLTGRVTAMEEATNSARTSRWPAIPSNPRELLTEAMASITGIAFEAGEDVAAIPLIQVEPFSWVASLRRVLLWIKAESSGTPTVAAGFQVDDGAVITVFRVKGSFSGNLAELENLMVTPGGEEPLPLGETVRNNRGEIWARLAGDCIEICMAQLQASTDLEARRTAGLIEGEPEFYNFDLFLPRSVHERQDLLQALLTDLDYVVVDTETTGLQLSQGDKVVSISAIRIQRGKVQNTGIFNTLVNPGRPIPPESTAIHHIDAGMVAAAPTMEEVYPQFVEFLGSSVLVAHNAAFDKKCLDMAATEAGLPLIDNPILDTIFLSYTLHQEFEGHSLEAIAERMGIQIDGRHTSLGDARATAHIFLGLLALLPARGVKTLADAKGFCDQHLLLRWQTSRF